MISDGPTNGVSPTNFCKVRGTGSLFTAMASIPSPLKIRVMATWEPTQSPSGRRCPITSTDEPCNCWTTLENEVDSERKDVIFRELAKEKYTLSNAWQKGKH